MRRSTLRLLTAGLALTLLSSHPLQARAQSAATSEVEALVARGIALRRAGQDREALAAFQEAEQLAPHSARVQVHLAGTYQALGDWLRADEYMTQALHQSGDPFVQRHRATLNLAQQTIDEHIGLLEIDGAPEDAEVRLNGEVKGRLPLKRPLQVVAGSYMLELSRQGYYSVRRPITIVGGELTRESLRLTTDTAFASTPVTFPAIAPDEGAHSRLTWLPWVLGGVSLAAAGVGTVAWVNRERHAERWNDEARCLRPGLTREAVCSSERLASERAETVLLVSAITAGLFAGGAIVTLTLDGDSSEAPQGAQLACGVNGVGVTCATQF